MATASKKRKRRNKRSSVGNWMKRRVSFVTSDAYHTLRLVNTIMAVRVLSHEGTHDTFEGPINHTWESRILPNIDKLNIFDKGVPKEWSQPLDLVGVLIADSHGMSAGHITWLVQSATTVVEAGAEQPEEEEEEDDA